MDDPITAEPPRPCKSCPGTGWIAGWRSAWQRGPRGPQKLPDVPADPTPCHRCNPDGRRAKPVPAPEAEPDVGLLMGGF
jgi:hypothetical protein